MWDYRLLPTHTFAKSEKNSIFHGSGRIDLAPE